MIIHQDVWWVFLIGAVRTIGKNLLGLLYFFIFLENLLESFSLVLLLNDYSLGDESKTTDSKTQSRLFV